VIKANSKAAAWIILAKTKHFLAKTPGNLSLKENNP
jgi:hypothetical protein